MLLRTLATGFALVSLSGCAALFAPSSQTLAQLPVVTFPDAPPPGEFVLRLPAGKPLPAHVAISGNALASGAERTLEVTLAHDLYVHRRWISEDGRHWKPIGDVLAIDLSLSLPSDEHPKPGELRLSIDRKDRK